ncbi:EKC/KEOPS complex subunit CGI121 [Cryptococcus amylolentus CBS 6039]|uniref:EKC/KEOPS complex subunit CGI121 n=2 Tax=Cryptococcus amylolentus TaxID=104669 RepID=A0A1E3HCH2_9TREE|nr:EKC/KEOPS complex subunit CGI121 [Cryptococcus amylolentus CBS 6039]ODN74024.1 EKC/KEOPS complex subunit CGI121 [Cryptococcus amylolentus CBS 6039]ODO00173.1 EKC/KEOPS complex subunit CGI121 [Cryptococcus amylolentus CBS 6273]
MESYALQNFPPAHSTIHVALFHNVTNAPQIRQRLIKASQYPPGEEGDKARADVDFGFVEGDLLVSKEHLLSALLATLLYAYPSTSPAPTDPPSLSPPDISSLALNSEQDRVPKTRSHNLHSEILLLLSPNNNISDSIRRHGLSEKTTRLAVVKFGKRGQSSEEVWKAMEDVVDGELVGLERVGEGVDWGKVDKVYKLSELNALKTPDVIEKKKAAVVSTVAVKNVI